jgi:hypothetical protein
MEIELPIVDESDPKHEWDSKEDIHWHLISFNSPFHFAKPKNWFAPIRTSRTIRKTGPRLV